MEANELRIGNYVKRNGVFVTCDFMSASNCYAVPEQYEPIKINELWLERFGFVIDGSNYFMDFINQEGINQTMAIETTVGVDDFGTIEIGIFSANFDKDGVIEETINYCKLSHIKHIHQLQNLYFSLTGQELTIKG